MQLGQLFGGATTSPFASDFLSNYAGGIMQATDRNIAAGPISSSPGANNPGTIKPPIGPEGDVVGTQALKMVASLVALIAGWAITSERLQATNIKIRKFARKQKNKNREENQPGFAS